MKELQYPFDSEFILKKAKTLKRLLLEENTDRIVKKIAVLGGSTTHDICKILELFLLEYGILPEFYESEYGQYWEDAMFPSETLRNFAPDLIVIHTSIRNITCFPKMNESEEEINDVLKQEYNKYEVMWEKLHNLYHCPIIQNNFESPFYRLLGNQDGVDLHGRLHFVNEFNRSISQYAQSHDSFYVNDIQYLSSCYGLTKWADPFYWHMYKYALCLQAIPELSHNIANIIKAIFGKNKKALVLDLDNTLWGGIVGDDGVEGLELGPDTSMGQVYVEFQEYIKAQKELGILLTVNSKNDPENADAGLRHPDSVLKPEDFVVIKANWNPKSENIKEIAAELSILPDSMVFVDDNPAEREIVQGQVPGAAVPAIGGPETYIQILDRSGYFEVVNLSEDDLKRNEMYQANQQRLQQQNTFVDYTQYLISLDMKAVIRPFETIYLARITQLTNKSNQFNLTTKRYTKDEIEQASKGKDYITLYGKLVDKFGDNGVVSVVIGKKENTNLHIELWLMSCRVLKRNMEEAMFDTLVEYCQKEGIQKITGYYYPTPKNAIVKDFYKDFGFMLEKEDEKGNTVWYYTIEPSYANKNQAIEIERN